jgi:hypothetical protein
MGFESYLFMQIILFLIITVLLMPGTAFSGAIQGVAIFSGKTEQLKPYKTGKYKKVCGSGIPNESILIDNKGVKNSVISLHGKKLKKRGGEYKLDQKKCRYEPHVIAVPLDSELKIHTSDPINHNIHTYSFENDPINIMFLPGQDAYSQEMEEAEVIKVECDLHDWMRAWVVVTPNAYSAVSGADGSFEIPDVPPGKYELTAWHETLGSLTKNITVGNDGLNVNFDFLEVSQEEANR